MELTVFAKSAHTQASIDSRCLEARGAAISLEQVFHFVTALYRTITWVTFTLESIWKFRSKLQMSKFSFRKCKKGKQNVNIHEMAIKLDCIFCLLFVSAFFWSGFENPLTWVTRAEAFRLIHFESNATLTIGTNCEMIRHLTHKFALNWSFL